MPTINNIKDCKCPAYHAESNFSIHGHYNRKVDYHIYYVKNEDFFHSVNDKIRMYKND